MKDEATRYRTVSYYQLLYYTARVDSSLNRCSALKVVTVFLLVLLSCSLLLMVIKMRPCPMALVCTHEMHGMDGNELAIAQ